MAAAPSRFRSRTTQPWTTFADEAGGRSPHSASASTSVLSGDRRPRTTSAERTTRSLGLRPLVWPSTWIGPSTAMPMP